MTNSTKDLNNAWATVTNPEPTPAELADLKRRQREDFQFMLVCASKGNMGMYRLLRDKSLPERR